MDLSFRKRENFVETSTVGNNQPEVLEEVTTHSYEYGAVPEREFLLSAFGFPEPAELRSKPRSIPFYVWAIVFGALALGGAAFCGTVNRGRNEVEVVAFVRGCAWCPAIGYSSRSA